jgi:putative membrane protein
VTTPETKPANDLIQPAHPAAKPTLREAIRVALTNWWDFGTVRARNKSPDQLAQDRTDMAATRTLMAADRTLMAWVRTSLSLLSFGFTIYKILQGFQDSGSLGIPHEYTPRTIGLFLTGMGTVAMVMGTIDYVATLRELHTLKDFRLTRPAFIMALLMSVTGLIMFFSIITKLF